MKRNNALTPTETILSVYNSGVYSIKGIVQCTGYSFSKVAKTLSDNGIILTENQAIILKLFDEGKNIDEIANYTGLSRKTVYKYLPRVQPPYMENRSKNALRIEKCRKSPGENNKEIAIADEKILNAYNSGANTIYSIRKITGYSAIRIAKTLSTNGIIINDIQKTILEMYQNGLTIEEIMEETQKGKSTVLSYLPRFKKK